MTGTQTFGPYSTIRQVGDVFFVSGQVPVDPETKSAPSGIQAQTSLALTNLETVLAEAGLDMQSVVKTTIYLADMDDFAPMNEVYVGYFKAPRPARSCVAVKELPRVGGDNAILVEIEAIAVKETN